MKKLFAAIISVLLMMTVILMPISAAQIEDNTVQPLWEHTSYLKCEITFDGNTGYANSVVRAYNGTSSIKTDIYVYEYVDNDWSYLTESHETVYHCISGARCPFTATVGGAYKADYTFTVTKDGVSEIITRTVYRNYTSQT